MLWDSTDLLCLQKFRKVRGRNKPLSHFLCALTKYRKAKYLRSPKCALWRCGSSPIQPGHTYTSGVTQGGDLGLLRSLLDDALLGRQLSHLQTAAVLADRSQNVERYG